MPSFAARAVLVAVALAFAAALSPAPAFAAGPNVTVKVAAATPLAGVLCPKEATFAADIVTSDWTGPAPHVVRYRWIRSDSAMGPVETARFGADGGTVRVETTWSLSESYSGWQAVEVLAPATMTSPHVDFHLSCPNTPTPRVIPTQPPASDVSADITTKIHLTAPPDAQACPKTLSFDGTVTVTNLAGSGPRNVQYVWIRSDGAHGPVVTAPLAPNGSATVHSTWDLGASYTGWEALQVFYPHAYQSHHHDFVLTCLEARPQQAPHH